MISLSLASYLLDLRTSDETDETRVSTISTCRMSQHVAHVLATPSTLSSNVLMKRLIVLHLHQAGRSVVCGKTGRVRDTAVGVATFSIDSAIAGAQSICASCMNMLCCVLSLHLISRQHSIRASALSFAVACLRSCLRLRRWRS